MEIPREIADAAGVPEDLDSSVLGPYTVPNTTRRRRASWYYLGGAILTGLAALGGLPAGLWAMAAVLALIGLYHLAAAVPLPVGDAQALFIANKATEFPVGHASAALGFRGWRALPVWNVLVFSADNPPSQRGLVRVDGRTGEVLDVYVEPVDGS